jgi:hypothetical protein
MDRYSVEEITCTEYAVDDSGNGIALRTGLHLEFDACGFVLARRSESGYTIHCLQATPDILPALHNRQTRALDTQFTGICICASSICYPPASLEFSKSWPNLKTDHKIEGGL